VSELTELQEKYDKLNTKYQSLRKRHINLKRLGRRILEVAERLIRCTSYEWDECTRQFRHAIKEKRGD